MAFRRVDQQRQQIQRNLQKRTGRNAITEFMEIETGLVYMLTSLKGNVSLLEEFKRRFAPRMSTRQRNDLDDVIVEAQQGLEMAQMTSDVSERVSNAYSKVLDHPGNYSRADGRLRDFSHQPPLVEVTPLHDDSEGGRITNIEQAN